MDRRQFLQTTAAAAVVAAGPMAGAPLAHGATPTVTLVVQTDLPAAALLARGVGEALARAGLAARPAGADGRALAQVQRIAELLDRARGTRLVGVMDDASAVVFQAVAATRGAACLAHRQHRIAGASAASFLIQPEETRP